MSDLILYYFESCPYCQKVFNYLKGKNIDLKLKNIHEDQEAASELVEVGGKNQVPCLFIDGDPLYESDDIINWLKSNLVEN
jgi:glutaredoxin